MSVSGFLQFWSVVFLITTTLVGVLKTEQDGGNAGDDEPDLGVVETYRWEIFCPVLTSYYSTIV